MYRHLHHQICKTKEKLKLYALICFQIATKINGKYDGIGYGAILGQGALKAHILHPCSIAKETDFNFDIKTFPTIEMEILFQLKFRIQMPSPYEIAVLVLHCADPTFDFSSVTERL